MKKRTRQKMWVSGLKWLTKRSWHKVINTIRNTIGQNILIRKMTTFCYHPTDLKLLCEKLSIIIHIKDWNLKFKLVFEILNQNLLIRFLMFCAVNVNTFIKYNNYILGKSNFSIKNRRYFTLCNSQRLPSITII